MSDALFNLWCTWRDTQRLKIWNVDIAYGCPKYIKRRLARLEEKFRENVIKVLRPEAT
jgi:hypothetical protein